MLEKGSLVSRNISGANNRGLIFIIRKTCEQRLVLIIGNLKFRCEIGYTNKWSVQSLPTVGPTSPFRVLADRTPYLNMHVWYHEYLCTEALAHGWKLLNQFPQFRYFSDFSPSWNHRLAIEFHIYNWQVSLQLSLSVFPQNHKFS